MKYVALIYLLASQVCFIAYYRDKRAAIKGGRRTPERTLHLLSLIGGWPGALLAQLALRHKSAKPRFLVVFWLTVLVNLIFLAAFIGKWSGLLA